MEENVKKFEELFAEIKRDGAEKLLDVIRKSDFYTAPASTKYHGAYKGGLLAHSLNVYECLAKKLEYDPTWKALGEKTGRETVLIVSLLHDLCKTYYYTTELRNRKIDGQWQQVEEYTISDRLPYGHGEKSVMMIEQYIKLTPEERYAIRWHMGPYSGQQDWGTLGIAMEMYPLCLALFEADMEATHLVESAE